MVDVWAEEFEKGSGDFNLTYPKGFGPSNGYFLLLNTFQTYSLWEKSNEFIISITNENNYFDIIRNFYTLEPGYFYKFKVQPSQITTTYKFDSMSKEDRNCGLHTDSSKLKYMQRYSESGCELEYGWVNFFYYQRLKLEILKLNNA
jgi:hypothetical protein